MEFILMESTNPNNTVYKRRYKCPYCDTRLERNRLITHIDKKHEDLIPKGYTATRVVFNIINKKEHGTCTICGKESPWNEDKARYDRICTNSKCKKEYEELVARRIMKVHGKTKEDMLHDPEFQSKMLAGRSISGTYKFSDGSKKTYTGSYEKNFVEFMDAYFHVKSEDLEMPGPVIEYEYESKKHMWITDAYYAPYNLVFDIKDGGDNPNNREMKSYREKQEVKEKAIAKLGTYNYIRLTNNNFEQLILLMLELKDLLIDNIGKDKDIKPIIRINESTDIINESLFINKKDLYLNIDKFESGKSNILLITGLSGSGKSTLASQLASKYKAEYIELDLFEHVEMFQSDNQLKEAGMVFYEYFSKYPNLKQKIINKELKGSEFANEIYKFIKYCLSWCSKHKSDKFIIEGVQLYDLYDSKAKENLPIGKYPIIIKNTSITKSILRAANRENKKIGEFIHNLPEKIKQYQISEKQLNQLISSITESTDISYDSRDIAKRMYSSGDIVRKENNHKETYNFIFSSNNYQKKEPEYLLYYPDIKVTDKEDINYNSKYDMIYRIGGEHARKLEEFKSKYKEASSDPNSNKKIIRIDKDIFSQLESSGIITEETLSDKYNAFHLEKEYKDPKNCGWDEELYYKTMNDLIKAKLKTLDNGKYHIYTCDKDLKAIYLGQISLEKDDDKFFYEWIKVNESALLENNMNNPSVNKDLVKKKYNPNNDQKSHLNYLKKKQRDNKTNSATKQSETPTPSKLNEEAIYTSKEKYPIFITLMHSGTPLSNLIKKVTKDEFSHACISFNSKLDPMYSFGSKKLEGFDLGLVRHNSNADFYKKYKAHYKVYTMFVDSNSYTKIMRRLKWFENNSEKLKYDLFGLIRIFFNYDTEKNKYKYFCSRFVAELIGNAKPLDKLPSLYKPEEFKDLYYVSLVNGGEDFSKYNYKNTERNLEQIKKGIYDDIMFSEDCSTTMGTMVGPKSNSDSVYVINYLKKNSFSGESNGDKEYALTTGKDMTDIFCYDKNKKSFDRTSFEEFRSITDSAELYRFDGYARILDLLENCNSDIDIYTSLSNMKFNNHDQIRNDHMFIREESLYDEINIIKESLEVSIHKMDKMRIPNIGMIAESALYTEGCPVMYYNDIDGVFVMNESTRMRSKSYKDIKSIPSSVIKYITIGRL